MRYLSLFSGIEAATAAWSELGWECVAVSEIDNFACKVLKHHYPKVPNLGDVTKITEEMVRALGPLDLIIFGSPCQDLSMAGTRKGMQHADGTITRSGLFFTAMQIIGWARQYCGLRFALWENVPGAYSSNAGRDFASVVAEMAGIDHVTVPANGWGTEGCAVGRDAMLEWSCLDAQWFGVAQRRRHCFALADFGDWANRRPILLEPESMRGDTAPRRETGQAIAADVAQCVTSSRAQRIGDPTGQDNVVAGTLLSSDGGADLHDACYGYLQPVAGALQANGKAAGSATGQDAEQGMLVPVAFGGNNQFGSIDVATARNACNSGSGSGSGRLDFESETFLVQPAYNVALRGRDGGATAELGDEVAGCLRASGGGGDKAHVLAFTCKDYGADASLNVAPTMRAMNSAHGNPNAGGQLAVCITGEVTHTLKADGFDGSEDGTGRGQPIVTAFQTRGSNVDVGEIAGTIGCNSGSASGSAPMANYGMSVRRLTTTECARLQDFPDKYLHEVLHKGKPPADGPMYKALGNSMCRSVILWIGKSIERALV